MSSISHSNPTSGNAPQGGASPKKDLELWENPSFQSMLSPKQRRATRHMGTIPRDRRGLRHHNLLAKK